MVRAPVERLVIEFQCALWTAASSVSGSWLVRSESLPTERATATALGAPSASVNESFRVRVSAFAELGIGSALLDSIA